MDIDSVANVEYMYSSISPSNDDCGNGEPNEGLTYTTTLPPDYTYNLAAGGKSADCSMGGCFDINCISVESRFRENLSHPTMGKAWSLLP